MLMKDLIKQYQLLSKEWEKEPIDLEKCADLLKSLKIGLTQFSYLPESDEGVSKQELLIARDILEIGARWAIATKDLSAFERYMSQLRSYYYDYRSDLPQSPYEYELLGLNLLFLLCQNRLAEFHTELERISIEDQLNNVYIKHPVSMEQYLMEGSYNKVFLSKGNVPSDRYNYFIDILLNTTRDAIADCMEAAYDMIEAVEAQRMLFFNSLGDLEAYRKTRAWDMSPSKEIVFHHPIQDAFARIPSLPVTKTMLEYAVELDKIV